jgi:hypothetical protein
VAGSLTPHMLVAGGYVGLDTAATRHAEYAGRASLRVPVEVFQSDVPVATS